MPLHDRSHVDSQGDVVVFDAFLERRVLDDVVVEVVGLHIARHLPECFERSLCHHYAAN